MKLESKLGVQVINFDGAFCGEQWFDNRAAQVAVTDYLCDRLGRKGEVAWFQGDPHWPAGAMRNEGFKQALSHHPGVHLVHENPMDWSSPVSLRTQGREFATRVLGEHPGLSAILVASDEAALGVADIVEAKGARGRVLIAGFDAIPEALVAITEGRMEASVIQPADEMAQRALTLAVERWQGKREVRRNGELPPRLVTRANVGDASLQALRIFTEVTRDLYELSDLQQQEAEFLETLLDNSPALTLVKEPALLRYVRVNRAQEAWHACPHNEQVGKTAYDFYAEPTAQAIEEADRRALAANLTVEIMEEEVAFLDGSVRTLHSRRIPIRNLYGVPVYLLYLADDVTERKLAAEKIRQHAEELELANRLLEENKERLVAAEKMAALGSLVAGIAHELNTPIGNGFMAATTLSASAARLAEAFPDRITRSLLKNYIDDTLDGMHLMERNLARAADLVSSFKQFAIDQTSSLPRRFALATVVDEMLMALSPMLKKTPFTLRVEIADDIVMDSYPGPLEQVLTNLISNALVHGLAGRETGTIAISARRLGLGEVELSVADDGAGIAPEILHRVFDPFFSTKFGSGGSGLGLSVSYTIVTGLLKGRIEVRSTPGQGACFTLNLPLAVV